MKISYKYAVALTSALGLFMAVLDNTIVNVALTPMVNAFHTDLNTVQWVITGYFLSQAAVIPAAGYLATRLGVKQVYMACLLIFTIGSLLCGLSDLVKDENGNPYIGLLIFFRIVQGIGGGALFPLSTSISFSVFPPNERAASSAIVGIPVLMAPSFGPTVGGLLIDSLGWQWIFFINVPIGLLAIFLIWRVYQPNRVVEGVPGSSKPLTPPVKTRFDFIGLILSMVGVVLVVYGFNIVAESNPSTVTTLNPRGDIYGWGYWQVWAFVGVGLLLLAAFAWYELRTKDPVLDLRTFKNRDFATASVLTWAVRGFIFGSFFLLPLFLQNIRYPHLSATVSGLSTMPMGLASAIAVVIGGRTLYDKIGPRYLILLGFAFLALSNLFLLGVDNNTDGWSLVPAMIVRGLGFGLAGIPLQTLALSAITGRELPRASSLYNVTAQIFSSIGIAILTTIFVQQTTAHRPDQAAIQQITTEVGQQQTTTFLQNHPGLSPATVQSSPDYPALQQQIGSTVGMRAAAEAGVPALRDVFLIVLVAMILMMGLVFILPRRPHYAEAATTAPPGETTPKRPAMAVGE